MENTLYNGQKELYSNRIGIPMILCDETCYAELSDDFTLPDYMPEIVRLLRVGVRVAPAESYLSGGVVKVACPLGYEVLYVGGDGNICYTELPASCEFSASVLTDVVWEQSKGAELWTDVSPESVISRVNGARKLNVRCRMAARIRAIGKRRVADEQSFPEDGQLQKLFSSAVYSVESFGANNDINVMDDIGTLRDGEKYLCTDCRVFVEQATAYDGYAECRGTIVMKHLLSGENGELRSISDKMNFSEIVEADGMRSGDSVAAFGRCFETVRNGDDEGEEGTVAPVSVSASVSIKVRGFRNEEIKYLKDAYSITNECFLQTERYRLPLHRAVFNRNMTFGGSESLEKIPNLTEYSRIMDVYAEAYDGKAELSDNGRYVINGKCRFSLIIANEVAEDDGGSPEYSAAEVELPFKYECAEEGDGFDVGGIELECIGARARLDGEKLELGCEIAIACGIVGYSEAEAVCSLTLGDTAERIRRGFTVCYPDKNDSLWSISKKYRARVDHTAEENGIELSTDADGCETLAGVKYMIV